jgi:hypothetical protein
MGVAEIILGPKIDHINPPNEWTLQFSWEAYEIAPYLPLYNNIRKYTMP